MLRTADVVTLPLTLYVTFHTSDLVESTLQIFRVFLGKDFMRRVLALAVECALQGSSPTL